MWGKNLTIINRIISDRHTYIQCCNVLLKTRPVSNIIMEILACF